MKKNNLDKDFVMNNLSLLVTKRELSLYNDLKDLVLLIRKYENSRMIYYYLYRYYDLIHFNFDTIVYFVTNCNRSFLETFLLDDDLDRFIDYLR